MELNAAEQAVVEYMRAQAIVDAAQIDGRARLVSEAQAAEEQARQAAEYERLSPEAKAVRDLPEEQQQALTELQNVERLRARLQRLEARLAEPARSALVLTAQASVEAALAQTQGVSAEPVTVKG